MGAFFSLVTGLSLPTFAIIFGEVVGTFDPRNGTSLDDLMEALFKTILTLAGGIWISGYIQYSFMQ